MESQNVYVSRRECHCQCQTARLNYLSVLNTYRKERHGKDRWRNQISGIKSPYALWPKSGLRELNILHSFSLASEGLPLLCHISDLCYPHCVTCEVLLCLHWGSWDNRQSEGLSGIYSSEGKLSLEEARLEALETHNNFSIFSIYSAPFRYCSEDKYPSWSTGSH